MQAYILQNGRTEAATMWKGMGGFLTAILESGDTLQMEIPTRWLGLKDLTPPHTKVGDVQSRRKRSLTHECAHEIAHDRTHEG